MNNTKGNTLVGVLAATAAYVIYGLNTVFCKDLTNSELITPTVLFTIRTGGAALLFWIISFFLPRERLDRRELSLALLASVLCIIIPQYSTLIGITMSTPYDVSMVSTLKPVLTLSVAFLLAKEKFRPALLIGVLLTFAGAVVLVSKPSGAFSTSALGFLIILMNGVSFAFYLVLFRDFISRHGTVTLMKWMFLFAFIVSMAVSTPQLVKTEFFAFDADMVKEIAFMVIFATFITYFLMPLGQRNLTSTQYSLFSYVQCIVAAVIGYMMGLESLDAQKLLASVFFIAGVAIVRRA
jgi:drug/metabolite transporter (DMT)-like permease